MPSRARKIAEERPHPAPPTINTGFSTCFIDRYALGSSTGTTLAVEFEDRKHRTCQTRMRAETGMLEETPTKFIMPARTALVLFASTAQGLEPLAGRRPSMFTD